ncbi:chorismate mutase [Candidatus Bathyarchaeota archaeon]|nr:chorismate mutase [Candidatus Bathyarchaeota archaeon]
MTSERIAELREEINGLNVQIVELLARRVEVARRIGEAKRERNLPIVDRTREGKVYVRVRELAMEWDLDPEGVEKVFREIVDLCTKAQLEESA